MSKKSPGARSLRRLVRQRVWVVEWDDPIAESDGTFPVAYTTENAAKKRAERLMQKEAENDEYTSVRYYVRAFEVVGAMPNNGTELRAQQNNE